MTQSQPPNGSQPAGKTSGWQALLVLPALGSLGLGVVLPLWILAVCFSTALSVSWCEYRLRQLGLRSQDLLLMATLVSAVLVLGGLGAATWERLQEALRQGSEAQARGAPKRWLLRHPWWTLGLGLILANGVLGSEPIRHPLAAASVLLALSSWLILTAIWLTWRTAWGSLRLGWRLSRASSFMAGLVVAAGLFTVAGWGLFLRVAEEALQSAQPALSRALQQPHSQSGWRLANLGSRLPISAPPPAVPALFERAQHGALQLVPVHFANLGGEDDFEGEGLAAEAYGEGPLDALADCLQGLNSQLRVEATSLAGRYVDSFEAQDVVQDVLLRVCLRGRSPSLAPGYFIRSVQNRALEWRRRAARVCSFIEAPETACARQPEEDYLREEQSRAVNKALCALSEDEQEMLRLRFFEREEYSEIAQRLGATQTSARQRVSRALKKFKAAFQEKCL